MSETSGRLRREFTAYYAGMKIIPNQSEWLIADAIDRLAADVAAIKAKVDDIAPDDVRHFVESEKAFAELFAEQRDAAISQRDEARADVERLKNELYDRVQEILSLRADTVERYEPHAAPQPAAPPAGWLTDDERKVIIWAASELSAIGHNRPPDNEQCLRLSEDLRRLAKRHDAGSTPVVEVPLFENYAPEVLHLRYRAAMDRAGVKWKEVGRE